MTAAWSSSARRRRSTSSPDMSGQHHVEDHDVGAALAPGLQRGEAVGGDHRLEARPAQVRGEHARDGGVVLDDQHGCDHTGRVCRVAAPQLPVARCAPARKGFVIGARASRAPWHLASSHVPVRGGRRRPPVPRRGAGAALGPRPHAALGSPDPRGQRLDRRLRRDRDRAAGSRSWRCSSGGTGRPATRASGVPPLPSWRSWTPTPASTRARSRCCCTPMRRP